MGIITYFQRLKEKFSARKLLRKESAERFYTKCKEGFFSFFRPYLTRNGFYLELEDREGLANFIRNGEVESPALTEPRTSQSSLQRKVEEYTKPIYDAFQRMINYFREFPKDDLGRYDSLSFHYRLFMSGCDVSSRGNKLNFSFG